MNAETLLWQRVDSPYWDDVLKGLVATHAAETTSRYARMLLHDWQRERRHFWQVVPKEYVKYLPHRLTGEAAEARRA